MPHKSGGYAGGSAEGGFKGQDAQHVVDDWAPFGCQLPRTAVLVGPDGGGNILYAGREGATSPC